MYKRNQASSLYYSLLQKYQLFIYMSILTSQVLKVTLLVCFEAFCLFLGCFFFFSHFALVILLG